MAVPLKSGGHPPQGRPTPGLAGDCPKDQRAPTQGLWAGRGYFFNTVGTHVSILDFGGYVSEVVRGSGTRVGALVG